MTIKKVKGDGTIPPKGFFKYIIWSLFGNVQDGVIGDTGWNPEQKDTVWIRLKWFFRNPFHNFTFYTLGNLHKDRTVKCYPSFNVFNPKLGWLFTVSKNDDGIMRYPFVSYIGRIKFYIGWRFGGSFGFKLINNSDNK